MAPLLGADGRKIGAGPRCQQAPALELTGCTSTGVWDILPFCRAHPPRAALLPALEGAQHKYHLPLAVSEAGSGVPSSEPFFPMEFHPMSQPSLAQANTDCGGNPWVQGSSQTWVLLSGDIALERGSQGQPGQDHM